MPDRPDTPQLQLDFEAEPEAVSRLTPAPRSNVIRLGLSLLRRGSRTERIPDQVDSVLEEVLSDAKKLKW